MSDECIRRSPNKKRIIETMNMETLIEYSRIHVSVDSQELIDRLVNELAVRVVEDEIRKG